MRIICLLYCLCLVSVNQFAQREVFIGLTLDEVEKIYPGMEKFIYENTTTLSRKTIFYGLEDKITYRFEDGKLNWIFFHKYISEINEANFKKCLNATNQIIENFSIIYGKPDTIITGNTSFIDPTKKRHWGYDVIEARWKNYKSMKIKVEFTFFGGKGNYNFIVSINYFDKNYPYYD